MASFDDLDAPQYSTFDDTDLGEVETYFEIDHEADYYQKKKTSTPEQTAEEKFYTPTPSNSESTALSTGKFIELRNRKVKRSKSEDNIPNQNILPKEDAQQSNVLKNKVDKFEFGKLTKNKSSSYSKLKWCSQESLNRLAAPKSTHSSKGNLAHSNEYVSVAEAIKKFQELTPTRFHSQNKNHNFLHNRTSHKGMPALKLKATIPHSPRLLTKTRTKHLPPVLSYQERERLEFEEAQKFKIKAHPINKKILQQPMKAIHVDKKPATIPEPFKLTQINSKKTNPSPKKAEYQFHARPVPKSVLEAPKLPEKPNVPVTTPSTPSFLKKISKPSPVKKEIEKKPNVRLGNTKPEPFSFEKRDINLHRKREELIQKVVEVEKKAREFHANPIPKPVATIINKQKQKSLNGSSCSSNQGDQTSQGDIPVDHFKARPPTVLYQKPFEPKRLEQPLTEIQPFQLYSERRAKEREMFERKKREQEERAAEILKLEEEERIRKEQEEIKKLRKEIIFKAHPVRNFKEVIIKPSGKVTEPISPVFLSGKSNKENLKQQQTC